MGPRSLNRGNVTPPEALTPAGAASMGPRSLNRGNQALRRDLRVRITLQWGRGLSTAEMPVIDERIMTVERASMGPRSLNRGNM